MTDRERPPRPGQSLAFDFDAAPSPSSPPAAPVPARKEAPRVFTVAELGRIVGRALERSFAEAVWVEGEVTGARPAPSGHVYFCLKDEEEEAMVDVVLYRSNVTPRARALVKDGARLRVRGKATFWAPRGRLQLVADRLEPTGKGALLEALELLKAKLLAEGLFAAERKRKLPEDPRIVGVVTSRAGAVIHDVCKVAFRRGGARILLAPAQVQGIGSAIAVRRALALLQRIAEVDVIIVGRGGGSQDDLLAFSDEELVRDVAACRVPIVSAVGHETDVTLVDFAADARAATPSQAAEMVVPDASARIRLFEERVHRLRRAMRARIAEERAALAHLARAFGDPRLTIANGQQRLDDRVVRLERAMDRQVARGRDTSRALDQRLGAAHPRERLHRDRARLLELQGRLALVMRGRLASRVDQSDKLASAIRHRLVAAQSRSTTLRGRLDALSPLDVLARGYAIATRADGHAVRDPGEVRPGEEIRVRVAAGTFAATVATASETDGTASPRAPGSKQP